MIIDIPNSFIKFNIPSYFYSCKLLNEPNLCLPIAEVNDVRFQILTPTSEFVNAFPLVPEINGNAFYFRFVNTCNQGFELGNRTTPPGIMDRLLTAPTNIGDNNTVLFTDPSGLNLQNLDAFDCGECLKIQIIKRTLIDVEFQPFPNPPVNIYSYSFQGCSNCFYKECDKCYTTTIRYRSNENSMGFFYRSINNLNVNILSQFSNALRLRFYLKAPQFETKQTVFTLSNGNKKKLAARVEKEWSAVVDWMPQEWHERLVLATEHDQFVVEAQQLSGNMMKEGGYEINWEDFLNYQVAQSTFKLKTIPYNNVNTNCNNG